MDTQELIAEPKMSSTKVERVFQVANALGARLLVHSFYPSNRQVVKAMCHKYDMKFAWENHVESNSREVLDRIGDSTGWIGACVHTGWFETQCCDPLLKMDELKSKAPIHLSAARERLVARVRRSGVGSGSWIVRVSNEQNWRHAADLGRGFVESGNRRLFSNG